jgi:TolB protein
MKFIASNFSAIKFFYLVTLTCRSSSKALIKLFDLRTSEKKFERDFNLDDSSSRAAIHAVSDQVYEKITGKKSFFLSRIVFISDYGSNPPRKIVKELYVMDFDGFNSQRLTSHGGIVISPAVSYDNKKVLYSLIENGTKNKNINLYEIDIASKKSRPLSSRAGINSGAIYTPDGRSIILTLSHEGNAEIYQMDLASGSLRNITKHSAEDVDPSINRDGSLLTFLSSRAGRAMIYTLDPRGLEKDVKRVSFVGQFNASPRFAPDGSEIVFASWVDNGFDLYRLSADSQSLVRLSKDFGSNEEPTYSPDGEFIVFTSRRVLNRKTAEQKLYIMNREGQILGPLTQNIGQCFSPKFFN